MLVPQKYSNKLYLNNHLLFAFATSSHCVIITYLLKTTSWSVHFYTTLHVTVIQEH